MKRFFTILVCKVIRKLCALIGRGSSFPGQLALKLCPDILQRVKLPQDVIAVSGSNGKTSTVEMILHILSSAGKTVACNTEGSNQIEGVTTLILSNCSLKGEFRKDILLMEVDERYAKYIFSYITPKYYVINNLYRDQMTRNGHPAYVFNDIRRSIHDGTTLIINADDPLIASLNYVTDNDCVGFGIMDNEYTSRECTSIYNDGYYCPLCHGHLIYDYHQFAHVGSYHCENGDFRRPELRYAITSVDLNESKITINDTYHISLAFASIINAYNVLAAFAVSSLVGINEEKIAASLNDYLIRNGRIREFRIGDKQGTLLISKHENSISYNQNMAYITGKEEVTLLLIIDDISRKYFTSDTSWLWDISFEMLASDKITQIVVAGKYINDVAVRFLAAGIDMDKVVLKQTTAEAVAYLKDNATANLFAMTCFSDEAKLLKEVEVL